MTPSGAYAATEALTIVECRETFIPTVDDFFKAFEKCASNKDLGDKPVSFI